MERILRHSPPNEYDQLPKHTLIEVIDTHEVYEQKAEDSNNPVWVVVEPVLPGLTR